MPVSAEGPFTAASLPVPVARVRKTRPAPFSLRFSDDERARLIAEAAGVPLGTYIKAKVLGDAPAPRLRRSGLSVEDRKMLAQALALRGASRLYSNLNQLAYLAHIGSLPFSPEIEADLQEALRDIRDMRRLLVAALGLKPEDAS